MKQLYIMIALACSSAAIYAREDTQVRVVNGTSHKLRLALASDYTYYSVPDYGYYSITLGESHDVSPLLTEWVTVAPGKTYTFNQNAYWVCPEYVVLKDTCQLRGKRATTFEKGAGYHAVALLEDTKAAGSRGQHTCSGNVTVTFAAPNKKSRKNKCQADVSVSGQLRIYNENKKG